MVNKRAYDPEASLRGSDGSYDPLIRKQNTFLEAKLEPKPLLHCSYAQLCLLFVVVATGGLVLGLLVFAAAEDGDDNGSCYIAPSCTVTSSADAYDNATGWTNNTGWGGVYSSSCCQICLDDMPTKVCFNPSDPNSQCMQKAGRSGDYYYLMLDQIWLPQWCNALAQGHDPTLSHLQGSVCNTATDNSASKNTAPVLLVHGLWPQYEDGFPQCCHSNSADPTPLTPSEVVGWNVWPELQTYWFDPTTTINETTASSSSSSAVLTDSSECDVCYLLNHEWLKHGTCYAADEIATEDPKQYFYAGLELYHALGGETFTNTVINIDSTTSSSSSGYGGSNTAAYTGANGNVSAMAGTFVNVTDIAALYPAVVNVLCDPQDPRTNATVGVLLEIQTCWEPVDAVSASTKSSSSGSDGSSRSSWGDVSSGADLNQLRRLGGPGSGSSRAATSYKPMACVPSNPSAFTTPCPDTVFVPVYAGA